MERKVKVRKLWKRRPETRIKDSNKIYNRDKEKRNFKKEITTLLIP
jgi:hypothetical protein